VLKQLVHWVGRPAFDAGLRSYSRSTRGATPRSPTCSAELEDDQRPRPRRVGGGLAAAPPASHAPARRSRTARRHDDRRPDPAGGAPVSTRAAPAPARRRRVRRRRTAGCGARPRSSSTSTASCTDVPSSSAAAPGAAARQRRRPGVREDPARRAVAERRRSRTCATSTSRCRDAGLERRVGHDPRRRDCRARTFVDLVLGNVARSTTRASPDAAAPARRHAGVLRRARSTGRRPAPRGRPAAGAAARPRRRQRPCSSCWRGRSPRTRSRRSRSSVLAGCWRHRRSRASPSTPTCAGACSPRWSRRAGRRAGDRGRARARRHATGRLHAAAAGPRSRRASEGRGLEAVVDEGELPNAVQAS
jgi:hypothetical protein